MRRIITNFFITILPIINVIMFPLRVLRVILTLGLGLSAFELLGYIGNANKSMIADGKLKFIIEGIILFLILDYLINLPEKLIERSIEKENEKYLKDQYHDQD